jgi:hypothetical protein
MGTVSAAIHLSLLREQVFDLGIGKRVTGFDSCLAGHGVEDRVQQFLATDISGHFRKGIQNITNQE